MSEKVKWIGFGEGSHFY